MFPRYCLPTSNEYENFRIEKKEAITYKIIRIKIVLDPQI